MDNGWLVFYPGDKFELCQGFIPLMTVTQENKAKIHPLIDFRELNEYIKIFTADANVYRQE